MELFCVSKINSLNWRKDCAIISWPSWNDARSCSLKILLIFTQWGCHCVESQLLKLISTLKRIISQRLLKRCNTFPHGWSAPFLLSLPPHKWFWICITICRHKLHPIILWKKSNLRDHRHKNSVINITFTGMQIQRPQNNPELRGHFHLTDPSLQKYSF